MSTLKNIIKPLKHDLKLFQKEFDLSLNSNVRIINIVSKYLIRNRGKKIRPILTLLAARLCGEPSLNSYRASAMVELLHLATLVHDDVVDDATIRRGFTSINKVWKNKISILMGDFILSKALINMISIKDFDALECISNTAEKLSSGELLQLEKSITKTMSESVYFDMIKQKTASLIACSCELGAITTKKKNSDRKAMYSYGENLGIAFQIKDDLLDLLGSENEIGKNKGGDIKRNMVTLPLIHAKRKMSAKQNRILKNLLNQLKKNKNVLDKIINLIKEAGGIKYTTGKLDYFSNKALGDIESYPESEFKESMINLVLFNKNRFS
ncbi:MAG: polyprenyl synthetase family protein [Candidatus Neomarinimicrobiota bacterium]